MSRLPLLLLLVAAGCTPPPAVQSPPPAPAPIGEPRDEPLEPGTVFPPFQAAGWLNGPPPPFDAMGTKGTVIDLWSDWCPYCRKTAPALVELHAKYAGRGVRFVSLTNQPEGAATAFGEQFGIGWPSGYGATPDTFAAYGARIPGEGGVSMYVAIPTFYLVAPDGKVRWCDQRARYRHTEPDVIAKDLDAAIAKLLADAGTAPRPGR